MKTVEKRSAGGVAYRDNERALEVALISTAREQRWQLPKGLIDPGETARDAAVREVREEAGIECEIVNEIEKIDYWYIERHSGEPERIHKTVFFFLMKYVSGDVADHDHEVHEARWFPIDEAVETLAFQSEKQILVMAKSMVSR